MSPEPLYDFRSRVMSISNGMSVNLIMDRLFRFQVAKEWMQPITLYISSEMTEQPRSVPEFAQIHAVLRLLRSPIHTVALGGIIRGMDALLVAEGVKGHRYLLPHSILCIEPFDFGDLGLGNHQLGLGANQKGSIREQAAELLENEMNRILLQLGIKPELFETSKVLSAETAIQVGLADVIVAPMREALPELVAESQISDPSEETR